MNIVQHASPNMSKGRQGWTPDFIVCHITEGAFAGTVSWITNPASQVSYHYVVARNGQITQAVDISNTAWANGTNNSTDNRGNQHSQLVAVRERRVNANLFTISIGFEGRLAETGGRLAETQLNAAVWLIDNIQGAVWQRYQTEILLDNIVGHAHITPRWKPNCPGAGFPFEEIAKQLRQPAIAGNNSPSRWATEAWEWAIKHRITDGTNPHATPTREQVVQLLYNYHKCLPPA